ncbi:MAG: T9SS type A sorting domain-containing protein [Flavobacteriales bacterium]
MKTKQKIILYLLLILAQKGFAQDVHIPSAILKMSLVNSPANTNKDLEISFEEATAYTGELYISTSEDFTGLEAFVNVTKLNFMTTGSTVTLDLRKNIMLKSIVLENCNDLQNLYLPQNNLLDSIQCTEIPELKSIDLSGNSNLKFISFLFTGLTNLDVSQNVELETLSISYGNLTSIDLSNNNSLINFTCNHNKLTSLDVSKNLLLQSLSCYDNQLEGDLDLTKNIDLCYLLLDENKKLKTVCINDYKLKCAYLVDDSTTLSEDCKTNIFELNAKQEIYPNPVKNLLNIKGAVQSTVYSIEGREVLTTDTSYLDVSSLEPGLYFIQLKDTNGSSVTQRFIKE